MSVRVGWAITTLLLMLITQQPAPSNPTTYPVTVMLPANMKLPGAKLRVYRLDPAENDPVPHEEVKRGEETSIILGLPAGRFALEIGDVSNDTITLLRRSKFEVPAEKSVTLIASRSQYVATIGEPKNPVHISQAAVLQMRDGEFRWKAHDEHSAAPSLVLSPDEEYLVSCAAESSDTVLALWHKGKSPTAAVFSDQEATSRVSFATRPETPPLAEATVRMGFPDALIPVTNPTARKFVTNRGREMIDYRIKTVAGEVLKF
jgi:hypothetical protein